MESSKEGKAEKGIATFFKWFWGILFVGAALHYIIQIAPTVAALGVGYFASWFELLNSERAGRVLLVFVALWVVGKGFESVVAELREIKQLLRKEN